VEDLADAATTQPRVSADTWANRSATDEHVATGKQAERTTRRVAVRNSGSSATRCTVPIVLMACLIGRLCLARSIVPAAQATDRCSYANPQRVAGEARYAPTIPSGLVSRAGRMSLQRALLPKDFTKGQYAVRRLPVNLPSRCTRENGMGRVEPIVRARAVEGFALLVRELGPPLEIVERLLRAGVYKGVIEQITSGSRPRYHLRRFATQCAGSQRQIGPPA
jgi:hypothetical protein